MGLGGSLGGCGGRGGREEGRKGGREDVLSRLLERMSAQRLNGGVKRVGYLIVQTPWLRSRARQCNCEMVNCFNFSKGL